jgi:uncharacterized Zn-finger protein
MSKTEYKCDFCNTTYVHQRSLWRHKNTSEECSKKYKEEESKTYSCEKCFKTYARQDVYTRHFKSCKEQVSDNTQSLINNLDIANKKIVELQTEIKRLKRLNLLYVKQLETYEEEYTSDSEYDS